MEYGLGLGGLQSLGDEQQILILVLMEYGLGATMASVSVVTRRCLNPCFNGIWSRREFFCN